MLAHYTFKPFWFRNTPHWRQCVLADVADWMKFSAFLIESNDEVERYRVLIDADLFEDWAGPIHDTKGEMLWGLPDDGLVTEAPVTMIDMRRRLFKMIDDSTNNDWILRTRFPENIVAAWPVEECTCTPRCGWHSDSCDIGGRLLRENVWLGVMASTQEELCSRLDALDKIGDLAAVRVAILDPLLEGIAINCGSCGDCDPCFCGHPERCIAKQFPMGTPHDDRIDWVIVAGDVGPNARPCNLAWIRELRDQCRASSVPLYIKQLGSRPYVCHLEHDKPMHGDSSRRVDCRGEAGYGCKQLTLNDPKGGDPEEWPSDLRIREFPRSQTDGR